MRRKIAMIAVLGGLAAGLGCYHTAGKHDCGYNPADYPIPAISNPAQTYPVIGPVMADPVIPKSKNGGSDKDVVKDKKDKGKDPTDKGMKNEEGGF